MLRTALAPARVVVPAKRAMMLQTAQRWPYSRRVVQAGVGRRLKKAKGGNADAEDPQVQDAVAALTQLAQNP